jgi:hypothetical protein
VSLGSRYIKAAGVAKIGEIAKITETIARFIKSRLQRAGSVRPGCLIFELHADLSTSAPDDFAGFTHERVRRDGKSK